VRMVFTAERAEFLQLHALRHGLLVLHAGVVFALTLAALQCDLFSCHIFHGARSQESEFEIPTGLGFNSDS
jgi:hypothetical protein